MCKLVYAIFAAASLVVGVSGARATLLTFDDGATHNIANTSLLGDSIFVFDSPTQQTTTFRVLPGAELTRDPLLLLSIQLGPTGGGGAVLEMTGGNVHWPVLVDSGGCAELSGGVLESVDPSPAAPSLRVEPTAAPAHAIISGDAIVGFVLASGSSRIEIAGGSVGQIVALGGTSTYPVVTMSNGTTGTQAYSFGALNMSGGTNNGRLFGFGLSRLKVSGGTLADGLSCDDGCNATISGGTVNAPSTEPSFFLKEFGRVRVTAGTINSDVSVSGRVTQLSISGGTFNRPIRVAERAGGQDKLLVSGGSIAQGIESSNRGIITIHGGAIGAAAATSLSVIDESRASIFGGSFGAPLVAANTGEITIFGNGLVLNSGQLSGNLADGTPINVGTLTFGAGVITLVNGFTQQVFSGPWRPLTIPSAGIKLPPGLVDAEVYCDGTPQPTVSVGFGALPILDPPTLEELPNAHFVIEGLTNAVNPGDTPYEDTVPIEIHSLRLQSLEPVALSGGVEETLFITLQSERSAADPPAGPASGGTATLQFDTREFTLSFSLHYDIRTGAVDGPIVHSATDLLTSPEPAPWSPADGTVSSATGLEIPFFPGVSAGGRFAFDLQGTDIQLVAAQAALPVQVPALGANGSIVLGALLLGAGLAFLRRRRLRSV